jgi:phosphate transport system permease protein
MAKETPNLSQGEYQEGNSPRIFFYERLFNFLLRFSSWLVVGLLGGIFITLLIASLPSLKHMGLEFFTSSQWNPVTRQFGLLPFLSGTLLTSFLALLISLPFSLSIAILLGEYYKKGVFSTTLRNLIELLAAIPSVIYGFWALMVLVPLMTEFQSQIGVTPYGTSIFTASVILAIMIIPYSASIAREVINMTPQSLKEAAYSLGATRFEVIRTTVLPYARSGIVAGILLSLGRALGETMAVTMVIGNANNIPDGLFKPGNTMASVIANEFTEATGDIYLSALVEIGLLLFVVTVLINIVGKFIINKLQT